MFLAIGHWRVSSPRGYALLKGKDEEGRQGPATACPLQARITPSHGSETVHGRPEGHANNNARILFEVRSAAQPFLHPFDTFIFMYISDDSAPEAELHLRSPGAIFRPFPGLAPAL